MFWVILLLFFFVLNLPVHTEHKSDHKPLNTEEKCCPPHTYEYNEEGHLTCTKCKFDPKY